MEGLFPFGGDVTPSTFSTGSPFVTGVGGDASGMPEVLFLLFRCKEPWEKPGRLRVFPLPELARAKGDLR